MKIKLSKITQVKIVSSMYGTYAIILYKDSEKEISTINITFKL